MNRLERIESDMRRTRERIVALQAKLRELDAQRTEQENVQIVSAVRALDLTTDELSAFIKGGILPEAASAVPAARYQRKARPAKPDSGTEGTTPYPIEAGSEGTTDEG
jgi:hypothetical protein